MQEQKGISIGTYRAEEKQIDRNERIAGERFGERVKGRGIEGGRNRMVGRNR